MERPVETTFILGGCAVSAGGGPARKHGFVFRRDIRAGMFPPLSRLTWARGHGCEWWPSEARSRGSEGQTPCTLQSPGWRTAGAGWWCPGSAYWRCLPLYCAPQPISPDNLHLPGTPPLSDPESYNKDRTWCFKPENTFAKIYAMTAQICVINEAFQPWNSHGLMLLKSSGSLAFTLWFEIIFNLIVSVDKCVLFYIMFELFWFLLGSLLSFYSSHCFYTAYMSGFTRHFVLAFKVLQKSNKPETSFILIVYTCSLRSTLWNNFLTI